MVSLEPFRQGDVYLDYPFEEMKFRFEHATGKVFARCYGKPEYQVEQSSNLFHEAISAGRIIPREEYFAD